MISNEKEVKDVKTGSQNIKDILEYYHTCWLNRFSEGHNPKSYAMHYGIYKEDTANNDAAKLETNAFLVETLGIPTDKPVNLADFGCGIGGTCIFLAERFPHLSIYGINISQVQIDVAEKNAAARELKGNLQYLLCDYCNTSLQPSSMDFVIAVESIWHCDEKKKIFDEASRVLNSNGKFAFLDYFQTRETKNAEEAAVLKVFNEGWGAYQPGTGAIKEFEKDYEADLKAAGFSSVKSQSMLREIMKGIIHSVEKAQNKLKEGGISDSQAYHYEACIALKILADSGLIDYRIVVAQK